MSLASLKTVLSSFSFLQIRVFAPVNSPSTSRRKMHSEFSFFLSSSCDSFQDDFWTRPSKKNLETQFSLVRISKIWEEEEFSRGIICRSKCFSGQTKKSLLLICLFEFGLQHFEAGGVSHRILFSCMQIRTVSVEKTFFKKMCSVCLNNLLEFLRNRLSFVTFCSHLGFSLDDAEVPVSLQRRPCYALKEKENKR